MHSRVNQRPSSDVPQNCDEPNTHSQVGTPLHAAGSASHWKSKS